MLFALLSLLLLAANLDTAVRIRAVARVTGSTALLMNELAGSAAVVAIVALPWVLGGSSRPGRTSPGRSSWPSPPGSPGISALVLFVQDLARFEAKSGDEGEGQ